jgi:glycosyltransferase involved in cell wall biosynthesis
VNVVVAHPGKQHVYQTVLAAQEAGSLQAFATSVYFEPSSRFAHGASILASRFGARGILRSALSRSHPEIDSKKVVTFPWWAAVARLSWAFPIGSTFEQYAWGRTDASIAKWLSGLEQKPQIVHGFEGGARSTFEAAKTRGIITVLDVSNAHERAERALREEGESGGVGSTERVRAERDLADVLLAPSEFVEECLVESGVSKKQIVRLPYGADPDRFSVAEPQHDGLFRVLFVGSVSARKGVRYLLEAWRRLELRDAELILVGAADAFGRKLIADAPSSVRWVGCVGGHEVQQYFANADAFAFPSLAEGSALVTYEALASGLPVVTTTSSGSVVRDGVDGFVVAPRDVDAICDRIEALWRDRDLGRRLGLSGRSLIESEYTWRHYGRRLDDVYRRFA